MFTNMMKIHKQNVKLNFIESFYGGMIGDIVGSVFEFKHSKEIPNYNSILEIYNNHKYNIFNHDIGHFTDDTIFMLLAMESLIECNGFDKNHQIQKMGEYIDNGRFSQSSDCFDLGQCYRKAYENRPNYKPRSDAGGNGVLMKLAPFALYSLFNVDPIDKNRFYKQVVECTHGEIAVESAVKMGHLLERIYDCEEFSFDNLKIKDESMSSAGFCNGTYNLAIKHLKKYVENNLSFDVSLMNIIKEGNDTDTNACVLGQLIGCTTYYVYDYAYKDEVDNIVNKFIDFCLK